ncbi:MAG: hypothetical protein IJ544_00045 [Prevotella sp.]|nr:hypothetical protein [Prevotella sp.]
MRTTIRLNQDNHDQGMAEKGTSLAHYWWVICSLIVIIVILAALLCTNIQMFEHRIMTFLSFTATLLSIVLSIFAIMYSFYSMKESSQQWNAVKTAVKSIETYTNILSRSTEQMVDQVIKINRDLGSMQEKINISSEITNDSLKPIENVDNNIRNQARRNYSLGGLGFILKKDKK